MSFCFLNEVLVGVDRQLYKWNLKTGHRIVLIDKADSKIIDLQYLKNDRNELLIFYENDTQRLFDMNNNNFSTSKCEFKNSKVYLYDITYHKDNHNENVTKTQLFYIGYYLDTTLSRRSLDDQNCTLKSEETYGWDRLYGMKFMANNEALFLCFYSKNEGALLKQIDITKNNNNNITKEVSHRVYNFIINMEITDRFYIFAYYPNMLGLNPIDEIINDENMKDYLKIPDSSTIRYMKVFNDNKNLILQTSGSNNSFVYVHSFTNGQTFYFHNFPSSLHMKNHRAKIDFISENEIVLSGNGIQTAKGLFNRNFAYNKENKKAELFKKNNSYSKLEYAVYLLNYNKENGDFELEILEPKPMEYPLSRTTASLPKTTPTTTKTTSTTTSTTTTSTLSTNIRTTTSTKATATSTTKTAKISSTSTTATTTSLPKVTTKRSTTSTSVTSSTTSPTQTTSSTKKSTATTTTTAFITAKISSTSTTATTTSLPKVTTKRSTTSTSVTSSTTSPTQTTSSTKNSTATTAFTFLAVTTSTTTSTTVSASTATINQLFEVEEERFKADEKLAKDAAKNNYDLLQFCFIILGLILVSLLGFVLFKYFKNEKGIYYVNF
jgi:hypothetical protein